MGAQAGSTRALNAVNPKCSKIGARTEFRRCSGCKVLRYCSEACQIVDWLEEGLRRSHPSPDIHGISTSRDRAFLRFVLHHDYLEAKGNIISDRIPHPADIPSLTLFDYRQGRVKVETFDISAAPQKLPINTLYLADRMSRAMESDGRMELHVMVLPKGKDGRFWVVPFRTNSAVVRDSLVLMRAAFLRGGMAGVMAVSESLRLPHGFVEIH
ncbi:hypothetical protein K438DRAFT_2104176 [Mycena galopus ATCC 62051]|nr:hypothetical protein K438DRAFT_2109281 [Mycena galopus ATCC 62051]KAF8143765.1 hypothetical protein K438DRAFT_2104176 [Mycena galopus ATCC 62051]